MDVTLLAAVPLIRSADGWGASGIVVLGHDERGQSARACAIKADGQPQSIAGIFANGAACAVRRVVWQCTISRNCFSACRILRGGDVVD